VAAASRRRVAGSQRLLPCQGVEGDCKPDAWRSLKVVEAGQSGFWIGESQPRSAQLLHCPSVGP
jgi:hypothetical protein